jgi:hypothetical protein
MKSKLLAMLLMAGSTMFAGVRFGVGIGIGVPIAPAPVVVAPVIPPCPGPGYVWSGGIWVAPGAFYGGPRYYGRPYVGGYYGGHPVVRGYAHGYRR